MSTITPLLVPQVNVNDETVLLVRWNVPQFAQVATGDLVCEVETTKATAEVHACQSGVLVQSVNKGAHVRIGSSIGAIGPTRESTVAYLDANTGPASTAKGGVRATPKAIALAEQHGVSLDALKDRGVVGTIKESDVKAFLSDTQSDGGAPLPAALVKYLDRLGPLPPFDAVVAANLRRSIEHAILTSIDMNCQVSAANTLIQKELAAGRMVSLLHVVIGAAARVLRKFPRLMSFHYGGALYQYKAADVALVARSADGHLFTPVVRSADTLSLVEIAKGAQAATLRVMKGTAKVEDLEGACFTISHIPIPGTTRVAALPSFGQSAVLGVSAERSSVELVQGSLAERPIVTFTLSYDHTLCDGVYAAGFLSELVRNLEGLES